MRDLLGHTIAALAITPDARYLDVCTIAGRRFAYRAGWGGFTQVAGVDALLTETVLYVHGDEPDTWSLHTIRGVCKVMVQRRIVISMTPAPTFPVLTNLLEDFRLTS